MLALVASHPVLDAMALVVSALLLERVFVILAASVALALHGPYRRPGRNDAGPAGVFRDGAAAAVRAGCFGGGAVMDEIDVLLRALEQMLSQRAARARAAWGPEGEPNDAE